MDRVWASAMDRVRDWSRLHQLLGDVTLALNLTLTLTITPTLALTLTLALALTLTLTCISCLATYSNSARSMVLSRSVSNRWKSPCSFSRVQNGRPASAAERVRSSTDSLNAGSLASAIATEARRGFAGGAGLAGGGDGTRGSTGCLSGEGAPIAAVIAEAIADDRRLASAESERGCRRIAGVRAAAGV